MKILIICSFIILPNSHPVRAEMISTESFLSHQIQSNPRERLMILMDRKDVQKKMEEFGITPVEAKSRLASLSDSEVEKLNSKIDQLPAGADAVGSILGTAFAVFIILLITDILCWTKVFNFTRCARR